MEQQGIKQVLSNIQGLPTLPDTLAQIGAAFEPGVGSWAMVAAEALVRRQDHELVQGEDYDYE